MNSQRAVWVWRVAGLALALMTGIAIRHMTSPASPRVAPLPTSAPPVQPDAASPQTSSRVTPIVSPTFTHHASGVTDSQPPLTQNASRATDLDRAYALARTEPGRALELATALPPGRDRTDLITHLTAEWAAKTPEAAALWANQLEVSPLRDQVSVGVAAAWAESNPTAAADWALKSLEPGKPRDDAIMSVVQRWTQRDPEAAAAWVAAFPAGAFRDTAVQELVKLWSDENQASAGKWLNGLQLGAIRDTAVGAYVNKIVFQYPETAAHWAQEIQDDSFRTRELETVGENWLTADAASASAWITDAPLPEPTKARLLANHL